MSQLEMGAGNAKLKLSIAAALLGIFGVAAYSFMGSSADADAHQGTALAAKPSSLPAASPAPGTSQSPAVAEAPAAQNTEAGADPSATAELNEAVPQQERAELAMDAAQASTEPEPAAAEALTLDDVSSAEGDAAPAPPRSVQRRVAHNQAVAPRRPPAAPVLSEWWKGDPSSPFAVDFVGQAQDSNALVILFAKPVDAQKAAARVRLLSEDGKAVALNMDRGNSPRVLVQANLAPGRYTVIVDAGTKVAGPVFIQ